MGPASGSKRPLLLSNEIKRRLEGEWQAGKKKTGQTLLYAIVNELVTIAMKDKSRKLRLQAIHEILDRTEGKPAQSVTVTGPGGGPLQLLAGEFDLDQLKEAEAQLLAELKLLGAAVIDVEVVTESHVTDPDGAASPEPRTVSGEGGSPSPAENPAAGAGAEGL